MASNYVSLEEAAKALGVPADRLVEMRSQGEIRGFRDGASWKFPQAEIDRLLTESGINLGEEDAMPGGSSILVSEPDSGAATGSDVSAGSDVALVARQGDGSDVQVVSSRSGDKAPPHESLEEADDDDLKLTDENESGVLDLAVDSKEGSTGPVIGAEDLQAAEEGGTGPESDLNLERHGSDADVLGDLDLVGAEQGGTDDLIQGDSDPSLVGGPDDVDDALSDDDELVIADDDDDDLVLSGAESDISVAGDSGVNLMSPSDSGLSLESEPLDLAGSSISALDLGENASPSKGGSGSGSLVDFEADEEFQLSPSGVGVDDDDSGSQVIEVEDSAAFVGDADLGDDAFGGGTEVVGEGLLDGDAMVADDALVAEDAMDDGFGIEAGGPARAGAAVPVAYETPFSMWSVIALGGILLLMSLCGMLMTDLVRNMWTYSEPAAPVSSLTDALISMFGLD